ncbi:MAG: BACON domain-containing protein [Dysgonamonadaceae bacterium]|jgi:hypothetical protein|nr:BACON domain-containing protein [Dysgonamonadaceae bacterium]
MKSFFKLLILSSLVLFCSCEKNELEEESYETYFSVPTQINKINSAANGYFISIEASADVSWNATIPTGSGNDWITLDTMSGKGNGSINFNLKANESRNSRSIEITFTASSDRSSTLMPSQKCVISQIGTAPAIEIYPVGTDSISTTAVPNYTIAVTANVTWTASIQITSGSEGWISIIAPPGTPVTGEGEVKLNILENTSVESRVAIVTIASTDDPALKKTLTIIQQGVIPSIVLSPTGMESISAKANEVYQVTVTSNIEWQSFVEIDQGDEADWIMIKSPAGAFTGNGSIILNIKANNGAAKRTAILHVKSTASSTSTNPDQTLTITQINAGAVFSIFIPKYTVLTTGSAAMNISPYPSGEAQNVDVDVISNASGITIEFSHPLSAGNYIVNSLTYGANSSVDVGVVITTDNAGTVTFVEHWDVAFNCFGGSLAERPIAIKNLADLNTLRTAVNAGDNYAGIILKQTSNIALAGDWNPIGNVDANPFAGIYDGNNQSITNLHISSGADRALFGYIGGVNADSVAVIKNLIIEGSGGIVADVTGEDGATVAGMVAVVAANTLIDNCINRANITAPGIGNIGGLAGKCTGDNITIAGCKNYGKIIGTGGNNGGIAARLSSTANENIHITSCRNYGDLEIASTTTSVTGGVVGCTVNPAKAEIKWCSNHGNISLNGVNAPNGTGGIIGSLLGNSVVQECFNLGNINAFTNTGGIAGLMNPGAGATNTSSINNCYNKGTILYTTRTAVNNGGIAGNLTNYWTAPVEYCYNAGATAMPPTAADRYSGIASANNIPNGSLSAFSGVKGCFYESDLGYVGGLGGNVPPTDVTGAAEGKTTAEMKTATPYTADWSAFIWQFTVGQYPSLKNNPEK